jgi:hypothetical protein
MMKKFLILQLIFLFFITACITEDGDMCINALDCEPGYNCIMGECVPGENIVNDNDQNHNPTVDNDQNVNQDKDSTIIPDDETGDDEVGDDEAIDDGNIKNDEDVTETVVCKPDSCSGNGDCSVVSDAIICDCSEEYKGDICSECSAGYLKSKTDDKCKPDCTTGKITCLEHMICKVNVTTNEAGCDCKDGYFGTNCSQCDANHFCSSKGTCWVSSNVATCDCNTGYGGTNCAGCADSYLEHNGGCIEGCKNYCGSNMGTITIDGTLYFIVAKSRGKCEIVQNKATCVCDQGWKSSLEYTIPGQIKPPCSDCDADDPPPEGCPE